MFVWRWCPANAEARGGLFYSSEWTWGPDSTGVSQDELPLLETNQDRTACRRVVYACGAGMEAQPPGPLLLQVRHLGHREAAHHKTVCACLCGARRQVGSQLCTPASFTCLSADRDHHLTVTPLPSAGTFANIIK